jgi:hypothetical protein
VILATFDNATQDELQRYENNYKALNLITTTLGRNVYDRVSHLENAHEVWINCVVPMRALMRLSLLIKILIIGVPSFFSKTW